MPRVFALLFFVVLGVAFPAGAAAQTSSTGGAQFSDPAPIVAPGAKATLLPDGSAAAPAEAPPEVQAAIFAANKLLDKPYKYGGGHAKVEDSGYDCSGTVSYALLAAKLIKSPLEPWRTWFLAHGVDAGEPAEGSSFNDIGLMCDAAAQGLGIALVRLKLGAPWLENGTLERISQRNVPSPHAHYLCWRTGTMDRWECAAFAEWLKKSLV